MCAGASVEGQSDDANGDNGANAGCDALIPEEYDKRDLGSHGDMRGALSIWSF